MSVSVYLLIYFLFPLFQVTVFVDASDAEEFSEAVSKPLRTLAYDVPGNTFVAFEKPVGVPAVGKFSNLLKFIVKEVTKPTLSFGITHGFFFKKKILFVAFIFAIEKII